MYKSKKINGGVGAKKQSIYKTPIRISTVVNVGESDFSEKSSQSGASNMKQSHTNIMHKERQSVMRPELVTSMMIDLSTPTSSWRRDSDNYTKDEVVIVNNKKNNCLNYYQNKQKSISKPNQNKFNKSLDIKFDISQRENDIQFFTGSNGSRRLSKIGFKPHPKTIIENWENARQTSISRKINAKWLTELKNNFQNSIQRQKATSYQQNKASLNTTDYSNASSAKKGLKSVSSLSHNGGFPTKTMKELSI